MTKAKKAKQAARILKATLGLPYTAARRQALASGGGNGYFFPSIESLLMPYVKDICDDLVETAVDSLGDVEPVDVPGLTEAEVRDLVVDLSTIDVQVVEEYEGGTEACSVFAVAELFIDGLMMKGEATMSADAGLVDVIEFDFNLHYSLVAVRQKQMIQLEFNAIATPDAESVEDFGFVGATTLT